MSKTFYRIGSDLEAVQAKAKHLADVFDDLESVIQMALIEALEDTAEAQNRHPNVGKKGYQRASFKQEEHDGFYTYKGSIDTTLVAEYLYIAVAEKIRREREFKEDGVELTLVAGDGSDEPLVIKGKMFANIVTDDPVWVKNLDSALERNLNVKVNDDIYRVDRAGDRTIGITAYRDYTLRRVM